MKKTETVHQWLLENRHRMANANVEKSGDKELSKKAIGYEEKKERPYKNRVKNFYLNVLLEKWTKTKKQKNIASALVATLAHLFETEIKAVAMSGLDGLDFIAYEFRSIGLSEFIKKQKKVLSSNKNLAARVIDIYANEFSTMVKTAMENQYFAIDGDYCGELSTFLPDIEKMLSKKIVMKNGIICLTFKKNSRKIKGIDATKQMVQLLKNYPDFALVPMFGNKDSNFYEYNDSLSGRGQKMVCCILERVA